MTIIFSFLTSDGLARVTVASLSDQMRMELLVQTMPERSQNNFKDKAGDFLSVCNWRYVSCDFDLNVKVINWSGLRKCGHFAFHMLPTNLEDLDVQGESFAFTKLSGTLETTSLPRSLVTMNLSVNSFTGSVDMSTLPSTMVGLQLQHNKFSGELDLKAFPPQMAVADLGYNSFSGSVNLTALPSSLRVLSLHCNAFEGEFNAADVPDELQLSIAGTKLVPIE